MLKIIEEYRKLSTSIISDAMGRRNVMDYGIKPLSDDMSIVGHAFTVKCPGGDNLIVHKAIYEAEPGDVLVIKVEDAIDRAVWGNVMSLAGELQDLEGVVVDGAVRDCLEIQDTCLPIFARLVTAKGSFKIGGGEFGGVIECGKVKVECGDLIVGDVDGVVVVPKDKIESVLKRAKELVEIEKQWIEGLIDGKTTLELLNLE